MAKKKTSKKKTKKSSKKSSSSKSKKSSSKSKELKHELIPKHTKLSEKEKKELLDKYNIDIKELPKMPADDSAIKSMGLKDNDVVKIERKSITSGTTVFYRGVVNE